ncbi:calcium-binding protein [Actinoplanes sp. NPDC024001]|uniref:calcium-binding protein n=1 Tax=Actinoplanes sp. NPDC024001 TaxID=3154598 RepID=UPI00340634A2
MPTRGNHMFLFNRKALALLGATAAAVASTAVLATPAQAASAGLVRTVGTGKVEFRALMGKANGVTLTIKGRTVTITDKVAIKAGKGCKSVSRTKVKCTTSKKTKTLSVALGDKNDWVKNKTSVFLLTAGGTGSDKLWGGSGADQLQGGSGSDTLYGKGGADVIFGESGADTIYGSTGDDIVEAGTGNDRVFLGTGVDYGFGEGGHDTIKGEGGNDYLIGESLTSAGEQIGSNSARDRLDGGSGKDFCLVLNAGATTGCELGVTASKEAAGVAARLADLRG